tara:strand:+ start:775 stop:1374 length:600 start_codon:yes stop_codon:yes gene_type:complete
MAFKQNPLQQRGPKTGAGIPETFKSPATQQQTYQQKLAASLKGIKDNDDSYQAKYKKERQDNVLDSLKTVVTEGRHAAAKKYGDEARKSDTNTTGALPLDASEPSYRTENYAKKSALKQTYKEKIKESLAKIKTNDASYEAKYLKERQDNVLDSLNTVATKGRRAAAKKYGDKARGKGLPTDASEKTYKTRKYIADSKK